MAQQGFILMKSDSRAYFPLTSNCKQMQFWLPAAMKANTQEAGADVKESGLFADAGHLEDGGLMSQNPSPGRLGFHVSKPMPWEDGHSHLKAHLLGRWRTHVSEPISVSQ